jgi:nicotinamidase-related amidase
MTLDPPHAALLITDPQTDLRAASSERGTAVHDVERLLEGARHADMVVAIAPHFCYPSDQRWGFGALLPECRPYLLGGRTIVAAPHRAWRSDDEALIAQLRRFGVAQVVLVGLWANRCVDAYLRALLERGFEVAVVRDASAWSPDDALRHM